MTSRQRIATGVNYWTARKRHVIPSPTQCKETRRCDELWRANVGKERQPLQMQNHEHERGRAQVEWYPVHRPHHTLERPCSGYRRIELHDRFESVARLVFGCVRLSATILVR